jgi:nucleotide-binding universal stress UspA family protein
MRSYLVVMDETEECTVALRFAARRAVAGGASVTILALIPNPEFVQWSGVQATMEAEAKLRAEARVVQASGTTFEEAGLHPSILVRQGDPVKVVGDVLRETPDIAALVLAARAEGGPGPLVAHFAGSVSGTLACPLIIVPGSLGEEALQDPA